MSSHCGCTGTSHASYTPLPSAAQPAAVTAHVYRYACRCNVPGVPTISLESPLKPGAHLCCVFVEAGLKVGLYTNTRELGD
jgi:hypothetical protein